MFRTAAIILLSIFGFQAAAIARNPYDCSVTGLSQTDPDGGLRVHSTPSAKDPTVGVIPFNATHIRNYKCQENDNKRWCLVKYIRPEGSVIGWAEARYLTGIPADDPSILPPIKEEPAPATSDQRTEPSRETKQAQNCTGGSDREIIEVDNMILQVLNESDELFRMTHRDFDPNGFFYYSAEIKDDQLKITEVYLSSPKYIPIHRKYVYELDFSDIAGAHVDNYSVTIDCRKSGCVTMTTNDVINSSRDIAHKNEYVILIPKTAANGFSTNYATVLNNLIKRRNYLKCNN